MSRNDNFELIWECEVKRIEQKKALAKLGYLVLEELKKQITEEVQKLWNEGVEKEIKGV